MVWPCHQGVVALQRNIDCPAPLYRLVNAMVEELSEEGEK